MLTHRLGHWKNGWRRVGEWLAMDFHTGEFSLGHNPTLFPANRAIGGYSHRACGFCSLLVHPQLPRNSWVSLG